MAVPPTTRAGSSAERPVARGVSRREGLGEATALELADLVRRRLVSSEEIVRFYLDRIEARDGELNSFVQVIRDDALRTARAKDRQRGSLPLFHGVPIGIKDLNFVRGTFARMGSRAFERFFTVFDCRTTEKIRAAGFVIVGKTATSELGVLPVTEPEIHAATRNPWDLSVTPGGSSGGAGAAVAGGLLPVAHGSDGGGSVRIPAALCGVFGFKPSRGRVANAYGHADEQILYTDGPLTRSVDDAAALLDVMAGVTTGRLHWAPPPVRSFLELSRRRSPRLRIRFTTEHSLGPVDPAIAAGVRRTAHVLSDLGHHVEEGARLEGDVEEFLPVWAHAAASAPVADWTQVQPVTRWLAELGRKVTDEQVGRVLRGLATQMSTWMGGADLALTPTVCVPTPPIGVIAGLGPREAFDRTASLGYFTAGFNASGQPAASFPIGLSPAGHPMGAQLVGRPFADAEVLSVCRELEAAIPFRHLTPPFPFESRS